MKPLSETVRRYLALTFIPLFVGHDLQAATTNERSFPVLRTSGFFTHQALSAPSLEMRVSVLNRTWGALQRAREAAVWRLSRRKSENGKPSQGDIERAKRYWKGELGTDPLPMKIRPSEEQDIPALFNMDRGTKARYRIRGLLAYSAGNGVRGWLGAGASSRQNPKDAPEEVFRLIEEQRGRREVSKSKAAIPIGKDVPPGQVRPRVISYMGLALFNMSRLDSILRRWAGARFRESECFMLANEEVVDELRDELARNNNFGLQKPIRMILQRRGARFVVPDREIDRSVATPASPIDRERGDVGKKYNRAIVEPQLAAGREDAVIIPGERVAQGHAEFFHQIVSSGYAFELFERGIEWFSIRNIDNIARTHDGEWLAMLGYFLENDIDFLAEVSPRTAGIEGGALVRDEHEQVRLTEDPNLLATWTATMDDQTRDGFNLVAPEEAIEVARAEFARQGHIDLISYRMNFREGQRVDQLDGLIAGLVPVQKTTKTVPPTYYLFRHANGNLRWVRRIFPQDTYWFNNAAGLFRPRFLYYLYAKQGQTVQEFVEELRAARKNAAARDAIAERGRGKFPLLLDPKPSKTTDAIAATPEGNMWQATIIADQITEPGTGRKAKVQAMGVQSLFNLNMTPAEFDQLSPEERANKLGALGFIATKKWGDAKDPKPETYAANVPWYRAFMDYVFRGPLLDTRELPPFDQVRTEIQRRDRTGGGTIFAMISSLSISGFLDFFRRLSAAVSIRSRPASHALSTSA